MFTRFPITKKGKTEAERPFWISYADLMTAMMTLCLVVMAVTILSINQKLASTENPEGPRTGGIQNICHQLEVKLKTVQDVHVNCENNRLEFGVAGQFDKDHWELKPEALPTLAKVTPVILTVADSVDGKNWLKQVVIEGFTDIDGSYLENLWLSLKRSYAVMCTLTDPSKNGSLGLSEAQVQQVRDIFLAGGVSFNNPKESLNESRRVELRLDFYTTKERGEHIGNSRRSTHSNGKEVCAIPTQSQTATDSSGALL